MLQKQSNCISRRKFALTLSRVGTLNRLIQVSRINGNINKRSAAGPARSILRKWDAVLVNWITGTQRFFSLVAFLTYKIDNITNVRRANISTALAQDFRRPWIQPLSFTPDSSFARTVNLCRRPGTWTSVSRYKACYFPVDEASSKTKADIR